MGARSRRGRELRHDGACAARATIYGARYYDPVLGRFLQSDTVLDGLNRYAYVRGNPVRYTDPARHEIREVGPDRYLNTETGEITVGYRPADPGAKSGRGSGSSGEGLSSQEPQYSLTLEYTRGQEWLHMQFDVYFRGELVFRHSASMAASNNQLDRVPGVSDPVRFHGYDYYPGPFPVGRHRITGAGYSEDPFIGPYVATDAEIDVQTYAFDEALQAWLPDAVVRDGGFLIHGGGYTSNETYDPNGNNKYRDNTWGCVRGMNADISRAIPYVQAVLNHGGTAEFVVNRQRPPVYGNTRGESRRDLPRWY